MKGLNSSSFGVYNCDQIYRLKNRKTIQPTFVDAATGETIRKPNVACVMDLDFNGSFSFNPNTITVDPTGKTAILLTAAKDAIYLIT